MMIKVYSLSLLLSIFSLVSHSQELSDEKFGKGVGFYSSGEFENAAKEWEELCRMGYKSADLYYNLGNAYFKTNNVPGAILYFERASLLKPADEDIIYNLEIARTLVTDRFEEIPELFFIKWFNFVSLTLPSNIWAITSLSAFLLSLIFLSAYLYSSHPKLRFSGFWIALLLILISILSVSFSVRNKNLIYDSRKAIIFSPVVNGKSSPDSSGTDLFLLHEGTKVTTVDQVGEWYEIRLSDGNKGWIPSNTLEII